MTVCENEDCNNSISSDEWFCNYCGEARPTCPKCGGEISYGTCNSCSAPRKAPCEECGTLIDANVRECPQCSYDAGAEYDKKAENKSVPKWKAVGGTILGTVIIGQILATSIHPLVWIPTLLAGGLMLLVLGPAAFLIDSWAGFRESQADIASAASVELGEKRNRSAEYVEEQRRKQELREQKKKEQRHRADIQCPDCGWDIEMVIEGKVTEVQADDNSSDAIGKVGSALDTIGADNSKECPTCGTTVYVSTELM